MNGILGKKIKLNPKAILVLEDGCAFNGIHIGSSGFARGELCFTTAMTGYQHCLTDPSFAGQILLFTAPHIGNVGINDKDNERDKVFIRGIVLREAITKTHHLDSVMGLDAWLKKNNIVGICGIDTRALTHHIRKNGTMNCVIASDCRDEVSKTVESFLLECPKAQGQELTQEVVNSSNASISMPSATSAASDQTVVIVDFGLKKSIYNFLLKYNVVVVAGREGFAEEVLKYNPDGIVLSNGPGDPEATKCFAVPEIQRLASAGIPIFAICIGHQLLALSFGCTTVKMHTGHRGINHPVYCLKSKKVSITSHNHGFMINPTSLSDIIEVTHKSLFDDCIEGIRIKNRPIFSVQYHPEASPGTSDSYYLFEQFYEMINEARS